MSTDIRGPFALYSNEQAAYDLTPTEDHRFVRGVVAQRSPKPNVIVMLLDCGDIVEFSGEHAKVVRAIVDPDQPLDNVFSLCEQCKVHWTPSRVLILPFATPCSACTRDVTDHTNFVRNHGGGDTITHLGCWMKMLFDPGPKIEVEVESENETP